MKKRKKKVSKFLRYLGKGLLFIVKLPYYCFKGAYLLDKKISEKDREVKVKKKRDSINSKYEKFKIIHVIEGDYSEWVNDVSKSDSQMGIILGARGSGKTAFAIKFLENFYSKYEKECFAIGFRKEELPSWINVVSDIGEIKNNSMVLIDEGGVLFNSRSSMSSANKLLSQLIMVARHKNISIIFISQNSSNLEVNILRQADFLVLKPSSLLQKDFERKIVQKIYESADKDFERFKEHQGLTHIYSGKFRGFVSNPLPSFWKEGISKGFA
ncbi:MAG: zonular occludens toxin domain-containing protein [archaeon]